MNKPAFALRITESVPAGLLRIVNRVSQAAMARVGKAGRDGESAVHETRLAIKQLRALLRLVRPVVAAGFFHAENARLREAASGLAPLRDVTAARRTIKKLLPRVKQARARAAFAKALETLDSQCRRQSRRPLARQRRSAVRSLESCARNWAKLRLPSRDSTAVVRGLGATYHQGRKWMRRAIDRGADSDFHGWRKRAKYLGYQIRVLSPVWPGRFKKMAEELDDLQQLLGADHDMVVLKAFFVPPSCGSSTSADSRRALSYLERRSRILRRRSLKAGKKVFEQKPAALMRQFLARWEERRRTI